MRLIKASSKAVKYAVENWHYSKTAPIHSYALAFAVIENERFCGVICYGIGATPNIARPYGMSNGQVIELMRVALNGKQSSTSKAVAISLRLVRKYAPNVQLIVSYADGEQQHTGTIYQATNWIYTGEVPTRSIIYKGKKTHPKTIYGKYGTQSVLKLKAKGIDVKSVQNKPKYKYIYPLDKRDREKYLHLAKPYPRA